MSECGGCRGEGAHVRWCVNVVGHRANWIGTASDRLEYLGDLIGSSDPALSNRCYALGEELMKRATAEADAWKEQR
jgi:hypothetical protein